MDYIFIIIYKRVGYSKDMLGKVKASCWSEAMEKAENGIKYMEEKLNNKYVLVNVLNVDAVEEWDI